MEHRRSCLTGGINKKQRIAPSTGLAWKRAVPCPTQPSGNQTILRRNRSLSCLCSLYYDKLLERHCLTSLSCEEKATRVSDLILGFTNFHVVCRRYAFSQGFFFFFRLFEVGERKEMEEKPEVVYL